MSQDLEEFLTLCQLLRTTTLLAMGVLLGRLLTSGGEMDDTTVHQILLGDHSHFIVAFGVMLLVHQVVGCEIAKAVGITLSASRAESLSRPMLMLQYSFKPVLWLISQLKRSIIQLL